MPNALPVCPARADAQLQRSRRLGHHTQGNLPKHSGCAAAESHIAVQWVLERLEALAQETKQCGDTVMLHDLCLAGVVPGQVAQSQCCKLSQVHITVRCQEREQRRNQAAVTNVCLGHVRPSCDIADGRERMLNHLHEQEVGCRGQKHM